MQISLPVVWEQWDNRRCSNIALLGSISADGVTRESLLEGVVGPRGDFDIPLEKNWSDVNYTLISEFLCRLGNIFGPNMYRYSDWTN